MSRKTLFISILVFAVVCVAIMYFLLVGESEKVPSGTAEDICLVFQDSDPSKPCYAVFPDVPRGEEPSNSQGEATSSPVSVALTPLEESCGSARSLFERNDCISEMARESKDETICDYVAGSLAQDACRRDVVEAPILTTSQKSPQSYQDLIEELFSEKPSKPSALASSVGQPISSTDPASLEADVRYNLSFGAPLAVYAASRYQAAPGSSIKIYGSGFTQDGNVLNIGASRTTLKSSDGSTLEALAPLSVGEYEIWVTNEKGTSRVAERPVRITITDSPADLPVIEKATPSPVSADGVVELSGTGFGSTNNLLTSLGIITDIPSSDGRTIRFSMSSLPYISYAKQAADLKGKISPVLVNIQTNAGASEKIFQFDVQF